MIIAPQEKQYWLDSLNNLSRKGSELIQVKGWVQDQMVGDCGELCIVSAGHEAARVNRTVGLSHVLREVLYYLDHAERWNDMDQRKSYQVVNFLDQLHVTEEILEDTFGPDWVTVCYLAQMFGAMTESHLEAWNQGKDQIEDLRLRQHIDHQITIDPAQLFRARDAVCAAYIDQCEDHCVYPLAPSVSLMATKMILPSLVS